jgi:hypothetical protein
MGTLEPSTKYQGPYKFEAFAAFISRDIWLSEIRFDFHH